MAGEVWSYVGRDFHERRDRIGLIALVLEAAEGTAFGAFYEDILVLHMETDDLGWSAGTRGRRWAVSEIYGWRRIA